MPKISAPTVAEHRERVISAIVSSAREVLSEKGYGGLTLGEVANRAGIARTSIYDYYVSKEDVLLAVYEEAVPDWVAEVEEAAAKADSPRGRISAYIETQLDMATNGKLRIVQVTRHAGLSNFTLDALANLLEPVVVPLAAAIRDLGHPDPERAAYLVLGIIDAAMWRIAKGEEQRALTDAAISLALDGLEAGKGGKSGRPR